MTKRKLLRACHAAAVCAAVGIFVPRPAHAEAGSDSAAAQGLFDQARALMAAGRAAEACPKLEESQRLDPGSGTLLNLAKCYEQTNRVASAWSTYLEAAVAARAAGNAEREAAARELAAALAPRVPKLVVEVPPDVRVAGLEIQRDGATVGAPQWGLPIPADAGEHAIVAIAPGRKPWRTTVTVSGDGATATIAVRALELEPQKPPGTHRAGSRPLGTQRVLALAAGSVGLVGVGVGTAFGLKSMSRHNEATSYCDGATCTDPRGVTAGNEAHSAGNVATVAMIVGAAGLAGAAVLWFTAPNERRAEVDVGLGGVQVKGVW